MSDLGGGVYGFEGDLPLDRVVRASIRFRANAYKSSKGTSGRTHYAMKRDEGHLLVRFFFGDGAQQAAKGFRDERKAQR